MISPILVTGATGNVGREVVRALRERGIAVRTAGRPPGPGRAAVRPPDPACAGALADVEAVPLDLARRETFGPALDRAPRARGLFLLRPPAIANVRDTLLPLVDEAAARGVEHVVFLSVAGAGENRLVPHHAVERHLRAGRLAWTILRPGFFAQNLGDAYRRDIAEDRRLFVPAGRGRVAFVDVRDVAEIAALAFAAPERHRGQAYTLTGPEAVSFFDAAAILTETLGRAIRYEPATLVGYARHLRRRGLPLAQIAVQTVLHAGLRLGQAEGVDPTLERLLGRPGRTLRAYVRDHAALWA
ncbi:NmrA family NAD(P)-binding protein [Sorangium cellulosum]|uniref:NmrA family NAD(P)-binding protein n=1 Tax=Sorangium cellulosum TaxID=56 RepID=UPI003D9A928E